jgi:beta-galactosidase
VDDGLDEAQLAECRAYRRENVKRRDILKLAGSGAASIVAGVPAIGGSTINANSVAARATKVLPERGARSLDDGWRFHLGDIPFSKVLGHDASYLNAKAGAARDAAAEDYDDSDWRELNLPHDWAIEGLAVPDENASQGYRKRGYGWYRRALRLDPASRGRYLEIQFGAIATNATIWFNGNLVSHNWSGYNSIYIDITSMARYGDDLNSIVVRVDAEKMEGWWYEGAGIYRHTWLIERAPVHIVSDGVHADPRKDADGRWAVPVTATLYNIGKKDAPVEVRAELIDETGKTVARASASGSAASLEQSTVSLTINGIQPKLWSIETPNLYTVKTIVLLDGKTVDERITACGFRTIRFDADKGFFLNDVHTKIQGTCIHQDHAGVGVAVPDALVDWRMRRLKELGCNAIRSAHNAPDVALLDACDRYGILVLNENRLFNVSPDYVDQLTWLVKRDRNRPCVFMWSVFNEEPMQATEAGYEMVRRMAAVVKDLDNSRPVTAAMNTGMFAPINVSAAVDVMGFNYNQLDYDRFHAANPTLPITSSEDTSAFQTRGAWTTDVSRNIINSDDTEKASWGVTHRDGWKAIAERPFVAGGFTWTAFDYHGEPTPHVWPSKSSYFGMMDLCGFAKTAFYIHQAHWIRDRPIAVIAPHWNWPGQEGKSIKVMAITNGDAVQLLLNGKTVAEGPVDQYDMAYFQVPYAPGRLEMVVTKGGKPHARTAVETTGTPVALRLTPDRRTLDGDGRDAQPITVEAVDAKGRAVPTANVSLTFSVAGGRIIGLGNGDPTAAQPSKGTAENLFNGLAQVIVQTDTGSVGALRLEVRSPGLKPAMLAIAVRAARLAAVDATRPTMRLKTWGASPVLANKPGPEPRTADGTLIAWQSVLAGVLPPEASGDGFILFTHTLKPGRKLAANGGTLRFASVTGRGSLWIDGKQVAEKATPATGILEAAIAPGSKPHEIAVILEAKEGDRIGFPGVIIVEANKVEP